MVFPIPGQLLARGCYAVARGGIFSIVGDGMVMRIYFSAVVFALAMLSAFPGAHAASTPPVKNKPQEPGQKQIEYTASQLLNVRRARVLKKSADFNFDQGDPELAANFYLRALALAPGAFSVGEKKLIASRLVVANRQREAIEVLRQLALEQGDDAEIRLSLAKLLSANENYTDAIAEVDRVLHQDRGNKYALLVKANSLRSQQKFGHSAFLYRRILEQGEDFDARVGLTYSLLAAGEKTKARESFGRLKTEDEEQQQQVDELGYYLESVTRPNIDLYTGTFTDSDNNRTEERRVTIRGASTDWDLAASSAQKTAISEGVTYTSDAVTGSASANFSEVLRFTMKLGQIKLGADQLRKYSTRNVEIDFKVGLHPVSVLNVDISHDVNATTGTQFVNVIEQDQSSIKFTRALDAKTMLYLTYHYRQYSDENSANDFQGSAQYTVYRGGPIVRAGYTYRQMNYNHPAFHGYFDPQNYKSNQGYLTLYYEYGSYYFDVEADYGRQKYERNFTGSNEPFKYVSATIGTTASKRFRLELHGEFNESGKSNAAYLYRDSLVSVQGSYMF